MFSTKKIKTIGGYCKRGLTLNEGKKLELQNVGILERDILSTRDSELKAPAFTKLNCVFIHPEQQNKRPTLAWVLPTVEKKSKVTTFLFSRHIWVGTCMLRV